MSWRPISSTYLKPAVVTSAVGGVLPSRIALVAVVVPWKTRRTSAGAPPARASTLRMAAMKPPERSPGVDGVFATQVAPVSLSAKVTSVKVPPTSMATVPDGRAAVIGRRDRGGRHGVRSAYSRLRSSGRRALLALESHLRTADSPSAVGTEVAELHRAPAACVDEARALVHVLSPPGRQRRDDHAELLALGGELVLRARRVLRALAPAHEPVRLHEPQPVGQDVGRDALERAQQVLEPPRPGQQVANHEQGPAVADQLERLRDRAGLVIALGHATIVVNLTSQGVTIILKVTCRVTPEARRCRSHSFAGRRSSGEIRPRHPSPT